MGYHGRVTVGGTPDVRELPALVITKIAVGALDNNAYLLRCRNTGEQLLIDAAAQPRTLLTLVNGALAAVVTTHRHSGHWQALAEVVAATGARTAAGEYDAAGIPVPTDIALKDGETIAVGSVPLRVIQLAGHTAGSIALLYDDPKGHPHLFAGDCLFLEGSKGSAHPDPDEDSAALLRDLKEKIFAVLPDETWVYPGHGHDTTLGAERPHLAERHAATQ
jgi:glyoxylase-like metal-dependent hydrolase (beta-lactamase superfamily II)